MLEKGDIIVITNVKRNVFSVKYKNMIKGSIAEVICINEYGAYTLMFPELNNIKQICDENNIEYKILKNKNRNLIKKLYEKAKIGGYVCE